MLVWTLGTVSVCMAWDASAKLRGRAAAERDVRAGRLEILIYGLPSASQVEYAQVFRKKYGVEVKVVAGCVVSEALVAYVAGYNEVSESLVKKRFGRQVFEAVEREAEALHRRKVR
jgi:hypothetical protein